MKLEDLQWTLTTLAHMTEEGEIQRLGFNFKGPTKDIQDGLYEKIDGEVRLTEHGISIALLIATTLIASLIKQAVANKKMEFADQAEAIEEVMAMIVEQTGKKGKIKTQIIKTNTKNHN